MLDLNFIRENPEKVKEVARQKGVQVDIDRLLQVDKEMRELQQKIDELRHQRNILAQQKEEGSRERAKQIRENIKELETKYRELQEERDYIWHRIPNVVYQEVPVGKDETDNVEVKKWGEIPHFPFKARSHIELAEMWDLADFKRGSKVSGFRGYFLKNKLAILHLGLLWWAFQKLVGKGYTPFVAPAIVKRFTLFGCGQFPWGERETYVLNDEDAYLAGTAEQPITSYYAGEVLSWRDLPQRFVAISPCFRREAGAHGKDTRGLYRLHEFWKVEQVIIAEADDQKAREYHEELQQNTEEIWQELKIPYRVILMCTGDMGEPQAKKYDTEAWMPYREDWGEVASNSIMTDFQARRLNIRYKDRDGKLRHVYTLNDTAIASPRALIAILENYQQEDGTIKVPEVLIPYVGFDKIP